MSSLSEASTELLLEQAFERPTPPSVIYLQQLRGVAARVQPTDTAYLHRFYHYDCGLWAIWQDSADTDKCIRWTREAWEALRHFLNRSFMSTC